MKYIRNTLIVLLTLYCLYLVKTAVGIDISSRYRAPEIIKLPIKALRYGMRELRG